MKPRSGDVVRSITLSFISAITLMATSVPASADWLAIKAAKPECQAHWSSKATGSEGTLGSRSTTSQLKVLSISPTEIKAALPPLAPGTYRLAVRQGRGEVSRFVVSVGGGGDARTPGPQGPPGPAGPMGPSGPEGLRALAGAAGSAGTAGLEG